MFWARCRASSGPLGGRYGARYGLIGPRIGLLEGPCGRQGVAILETNWAMLGVRTLERYVWPYRAFCAASSTSRQCFSLLCCPWSASRPRAGHGPCALQGDARVAQPFVMSPRLPFYTVFFGALNSCARGVPCFIYNAGSYRPVAKQRYPVHVSNIAPSPDLIMIAMRSPTMMFRRRLIFASVLLINIESALPLQ